MLGFKLERFEEEKGVFVVESNGCCLFDFIVGGVC